MRVWETGRAENRGLRWNAGRKKGRREGVEEVLKETQKKAFFLKKSLLFFFFHRLPDNLLSQSSLPALALMGAEPQVAGGVWRFCRCLTKFVAPMCFCCRRHASALRCRALRKTGGATIITIIIMVKKNWAIYQRRREGDSDTQTELASIFVF